MRGIQEAGTNINEASQEGTSLQSLLDDFEEVRVGVSQVVLLSNASGEVLETFNGAASGQSLVASIHSEGIVNRND